MKVLVVITRILSAVFVGMIIGGFIADKPVVWLCGLILLIFDIALGISFQFALDNKSAEARSSISSASQAESASASPLLQETSSFNKEVDLELMRIYENLRSERDDSDDYEDDEDEDFEYEEETETEETERESDLEMFQLVHSCLRLFGKSPIENILNDGPGTFLCAMCAKMDHAPSPRSLIPCISAEADFIGNYPAIVYRFNYSPRTYCQNALLYLVKVDDCLRLFTVETNPIGFFLCEYSGTRHLNYGEVTLNGVNQKINKIVNS